VSHAEKALMSFLLGRAKLELATNVIKLIGARIIL